MSVPARLLSVHPITRTRVALPVLAWAAIALFVGLVEARRDGRQILYRTNAEAIRPLHEWTGRFERYWRRQLTRIKEHAERQ